MKNPDKYEHVIGICVHCEREEELHLIQMCLPWSDDPDYELCCAECAWDWDNEQEGNYTRWKKRISPAYLILYRLEQNIKGGISCLPENESLSDDYDYS